VTHPTYTVTTSHTFTDSTLEDQHYGNAHAAWMAAAIDYATSDHGQDEDTQGQDVQYLADSYGVGTVTLSTGERVTVTAHA
jgi:hypothetical protein